MRLQLDTNFIENAVNTQQNYPNELEVYCKQNDWSTISSLLSAKKRDTQGHINYLTRELKRKGETLEWFMEIHKDEIPL